MLRNIFVLLLGLAITLSLGVVISEAQNPLEELPAAFLNAPPLVGAPLVDARPVPNLVEFPNRCLAIITDVTVKGDAEAINATVQDATIIEDCIGWQDVDDRIACTCYQDPYNGLIISGHGSVQGGIKASKENLVSSNISDQFIESLGDILTPEAPIFILGCGQGMREAEMQAFADQTGHPVVANTRCTYGGNQGDGEWVTFYPFSWEWRSELTAEVYDENRLVQ